MEPRPFLLPDEILERLAAGGGGAAAARYLVSAEQSRRRLMMLRMMELTSDLRHPHMPAAEHAYGVLAEVQRKHPEALVDALDRPAVGAWLQATVQELPAEDVRPGLLRPEPAQLGAVAAVAALKAGLPCRVEVPASDGVITLPSLGQIVLSPDRAGDDLVELRVHADGQVECEGMLLRPDGPEQPHWRPIRTITAGDDLVLLVDDLDPFRWSAEAVIEGRLGNNELHSWGRILESAWSQLAEHHWTIASELRVITNVLTPIKGPEQGMNSGSAEDRFGAIAMSTPPDSRWLSSIFAHEVQHAKLGAVLDVVKLLHPDQGRYYAPWRPDPRPLSGLLHGAYAYVGVSGFWRRQREAESDLRAHVEFAHWRRSAYDVTGTLLDSGRLTKTGRRFVTGMRRTLAGWLDEPVPAEALAVAGQEAEAHRADWLASNRDAKPAATG